MLQEPNYITQISEELQLKNYQVEVVLELIAEWATVPFIARYRKEKTGDLNEDNIREVIALKTKIENLYEAKKTAINGIEELGKMTPELMENILKAKTLKEVEDIYKPYKSKKKTKAMIAIENGFQIVADEIKKNKDLTKNDEVLQEFLKDFSFEEIIEWACEIIAAEISANADLRADLIETLQKYGELSSKYKTEKSLEKLNEKDKNQIPKFEIYNDFTLKISWLKPYQILALNRWEKLGILNKKIEKTDKTFEGIGYHYARILSCHSEQKSVIPDSDPESLDPETSSGWQRENSGWQMTNTRKNRISFPFSEQLTEWLKKWYDALFSSVENEIMSNLWEYWEDDAISTFQINLKNLLMTKPEYGKSILSIDPWYAAGCKIAVLDELWNPLEFSKIFLHREENAKTILWDLIKKYSPNVVIVGNWTWNLETIEVLKKVLEGEKNAPEIYIVNESWASVYSASKIAKEEFPDLDSLDRGTISLGRRFIDPLSELVKVPVWSIGVGLYQHDVAPKKLEEKLGNVVEDVVNEVWINVNNTSVYVLNQISWIDKRLAKKIYNNRPYKSREELKKQMNDKQYEQAIWFLRIPESEEKLDNTDIHPEQYELAKYILENVGNSGLNSLQGEGVAQFFNENKEKLENIYPDVNESTIEFILQSFKNAGIEKRTISTHKKVDFNEKKQEIKEWSIVNWIVKNVVAFGAFVDIWLKNDGLVHISEIADTFVKDPNEFLEVGQDVRVKVTKIDEKSRKIQLSMKGL